MKKALVLLLPIMMVIPLFANGNSETTATSASAKKDAVTLVVAGNPYRFYALSAKGCGGDDTWFSAMYMIVFFVLNQMEHSLQLWQRAIQYHRMG